MISTSSSRGRSHLFGGEYFQAGVELACDSSSGCNYQLVVQGHRSSDGAWILFASPRNGSQSETNGNFNRVPILPMNAFTPQQDYDAVRWWILSYSDGQRMRIYYPTLKLLPN